MMACNSEVFAAMVSPACQSSDAVRAARSANVVTASQMLVACVWVKLSGYRKNVLAKSSSVNTTTMPPTSVSGS